MGFPSGTEVKNPPTMHETQVMTVQSLDQDDPLEEEMETHCSILAGIIPWTEEPGKLQFMGSHGVIKSQTQLSMHACI